MIKIYHRAFKNEFKELPDFKVGAWIDVYNPSEKEVDDIVEMLGVDKGLLMDALDPFEVPRLESEDGVVYVFARAPEVKGVEITTVPFLIAIGGDFVLTISAQECAFLNEFRQGEKDIYTTKKVKFFLQVFSAIDRIYNHLLIGTNKKIRAMKIRLERIGNKDIIQFVDTERLLNDFLSALVPTNSVLQKILDGKHITLYEEDEDLIEDLLLGNGQLVETSKATLRHVTNIRSAYSNIMTHDLNRIMKILTALTIILTIPTIVFSFFGMNVVLPTDSTSIISIFTVLVSVSIFFIFMKKRWF